ncbi:hypothetical protein [Tellurirhabdus rosea]|uniref:hypothetical protein n=1 Tax=Tellurirhabdus rosea TaxID=2674997 RepID=UPI002259583D|nr:hypothetical protein [Tellurirhabdus rosea]
MNSGWLTAPFGIIYFPTSPHQIEKKASFAEHSSPFQFKSFFNSGKIFWHGPCNYQTRKQLKNLPPPTDRETF